MPSYVRETLAAAPRQEQVLYSGVWKKRAFDTEGSWLIIQRDDRRYLRLSEHFRTRSAPCLQVLLSPDPVNLLKDQGTPNGAALVSQLASNEGARLYEIAAAIDFARYRSILLWCERFSRLWSIASLTSR
jgi:hypothetical protein